jgi:hypothetical protein
MSPEVLTRARLNAPNIEAALERAGLAELIVDRAQGIRVRTRVHAAPQLLHDVDDVRWLVFDAIGGRA